MPRMVFIVVAIALIAGSFPTPGKEGSTRQYTFAWPFTDQDEMRPRGGTTRGPVVHLAPAPTAESKALNQSGRTPRERDRLAILALAGAYRTTFDFIETMGFSETYQPSRPYQSWGTEFIEVVADEPGFIQLQHIMVMHFAAPDGTLSEPVVVKHWRQDWRFEDRDLHVYAGHRTWERVRLPPEQVEGAWSQAVFQVDDSPRYEAIGRWVHRGNHSTWLGEPAWRPLPRRESSVRDDYHVLSGANRITITPHGWVQEHDNLKVVLNADGSLAADTPYLARETGLSRYQRIVDYDFSAGDAYWESTQAFWQEVREAWADIYRRRDQFTLRGEVDGAPLFSTMFGMADEFAKAPPDERARARARIEATLDRFIQ